jgi:alkanesulfonate monooxygenase SsuD/methylene tetrahydromethanopterin reductase-like flavin-dependent oxidoreductase (luciferase family)
MDIGFLLAATDQTGDFAQIARALESSDYESLWIPDHLVIPVAMKFFLCSRADIVSSRLSDCGQVYLAANK